jgi:hypothetical protein
MPPDGCGCHADIINTSVDRPFRAARMNHQDQERLLTDALERNAADLALNQQPVPAGTERLDISYSATDVPVEIVPATELRDDPQEPQR